MTKLKRLLSNTDQPLDWTLAVAMALSGVAGGALGFLVFGQETVGLSAVTGVVLGFVVRFAPLFMALRMLVLNGAVIVLAAITAVGFRHSPVAAALAMALLAFVCAAWTAIPVVGAMFSSLPVVVFLILVAKGESMVGQASVLEAGGAALAGVLGAALISVLLSIRDPRKADRSLVAATWNPVSPAATHATIARVLVMDGAPTAMQVVATQGGLAALCRRYLLRHGVAEDDPMIAAADANNRTIAAAVGPRGPFTPRKVNLNMAHLPAVDPDPGTTHHEPSGETTPETKAGAQDESTTDHAPAATPSDSSESAGRQAAVNLLVQAQTGAARVLTGEVSPPPLTTHPVMGVIRALLVTVLRPDASVFRYGVQRAVALGLGVAAIVLTDGGQSAFWITLTVSGVLQANAPTTAARVVQRAAGTFAGVLLAIGLSFVLPAGLLLPWVAGIAFLIGILYMRRNYAFMNVLLALAMVLIYGAPDDQVLRYAGLRAMDVVIGGVFAFVVAKAILPVRPRPEVRKRNLVANLNGFASDLRAHLHDPVGVPLKALALDLSRCDQAQENFSGDVALLRDPAKSAYQKQLGELCTCGENLITLAAIVVGLADLAAVGSLTVEDALTALETEVTKIGESPAVSAATA